MKKWLWTLIPFIGIALVIIFLPQIAASHLFGPKILHSISSDLDAKKITFSWGPLQQVEGVEYMTPEVRIKIPKVEIEKSFFSLLFDRQDLGTIKVLSPRLVYAGKEAGGAPNPSKEKGESKKIPYTGTVVISDGSCLIKTFTPIIELSAIELKAARKKEDGALSLEASAKSTKGALSGTLFAKALVDLVKKSAAIKTTISNFPTAALDAFAALSHPDFKGIISSAIGPTLNANGTLQLDPENFFVDGKASSQNLDVEIHTESNGKEIRLKEEGLLTLNLPAGFFLPKLGHLKKETTCTARVHNLSFPKSKKAILWDKGSYFAKIHCTPTTLASNGDLIDLEKALLVLNSKELRLGSELDLDLEGALNSNPIFAKVHALWDKKEIALTKTATLRYGDRAFAIEKGSIPSTFDLEKLHLNGKTLPPTPYPFKFDISSLRHVVLESNEKDFKGKLIAKKEDSAWQATLHLDRMALENHITLLDLDGEGTYEKNRASFAIDGGIDGIDTRGGKLRAKGEIKNFIPLSWETVQGEAKGTLSHLAIMEKESGTPLAIDDLSFQVEKSSLLSFLGSALFSTLTSNERGRIDFQGKADQKKDLYDLDLKGEDFPTSITSLFTTFPLYSLLGPKCHFSSSLSVREGAGPISFKLASPNSQLDLEGDVEQGVLHLTKPFFLHTLLTEEFGDALAKQTESKFSVWSRHPVILDLEPRGSQIPLFPFSWDQIDLPNGRLELGRLICKQAENVNLALDILKSDVNQDKEIDLWFAPLDFHMEKGETEIERTEILIDRRYDVATWGNVSFPKQYVDMTLGITSEAIRSAFGIKGLPPDYMIFVPMSGPFDNVKIDSSVATSKIALLIAGEHAPSVGGLFGGDVGEAVGGFLGAITKLPDGDKEAPPAKRPFPWQQREIEESPMPEKQHDKNNPLKDLLKVLKG